MVIWDHILIGTALGLSNYSDNPAILITTISASVFPDIDLAFGLPGSLKYLKNHRTFTHSLLFAPFYAFLIALFFHFLYMDRTEILILWFWSLLGILSHLFVDILNGFGAAIWYPLNKKRIAYDVFFEYDFIFTALFVLIISIQIVSINYFPNNLLIISLLLTIPLVFYYVSRIKSKAKFQNSVLSKSDYLQEKILESTFVPASYWRWKAILGSEKFNYIFRKIKDEIVFEKKAKEDIPLDLLVYPAKVYKAYARHLDVSISNNELIMTDLIYSSNTYRLSIIFDESKEFKYSISLPTLSPSEY